MTGWLLTFLALALCAIAICLWRGLPLALRGLPVALLAAFLLISFPRRGSNAPIGAKPDDFWADLPTPGVSQDCDDDTVPLLLKDYWDRSLPIATMSDEQIALLPRERLDLLRVHLNSLAHDNAKDGAWIDELDIAGSDKDILKLRWRVFDGPLFAHYADPKVWDSLMALPTSDAKHPIAAQVGAYELVLEDLLAVAQSRIDSADHEDETLPLPDHAVLSIEYLLANCVDLAKNRIEDGDYEDVDR